MSSRSNMLKAKGLVTFGSELDIPQGSLKVADNINIDEHGVVTPRRGYADFGDELPLEDDRLKQVLQYKGKILRHFNSTIQFENADTSFSDFSGSYSEVESGIRIKAQESNSNLYFTTDTGIQKISASSSSEFSTASDYITTAGAIKAVDLSGKTLPNDDGFLPAQSKVAYRVLFGYTDKNNNEILGAPSSRFVLTNTSEDILLNERSSITVGAGLTFSNSDYILLYSNTTNYFLWFKTAPSDVAPNTADTVGKTAIEVDVQTPGSQSNVALTITNAIVLAASGVLDSEIDATDSTTVLITTVDTGDTTDIATSAGFTSTLTISKIADGQITDGQPSNAELTFTIPEGVTTELGYFYRIYRSSSSTAILGLTLNDIVPEDELNLVLQSDILAADVTAGEIVVTDITPESFRAAGLPLYTNPISGQGILKANEQPPIAKDLALFNSHMFYSNTKTKQRQQFTIVSVDDFTSGFTELLIGNNAIARSYLFVGTTEKTDIVIDTLANTILGDYFDINSANNERDYRFWFSTSSSDIAPDSGGRSLVRVSLELTNVAAGNPADIIANTQVALETSINSIGDFSTSIYSNVVNSTIGTTTDSTFYNMGGSWSIEKLQDGTGSLAEDVNIIVDSKANTTSGGYLDINSAIDATQYRLWFSTDVTDTAPDAGGRVLSRVSLENFDGTKNGSQLALKTALDLLGDFTTTTNDDIHITNDNNGPTVDATMHTAGGSWAIGSITQGTGEDVALNQVLLSGLVSVGQAIDETARSLIRVINKDSSSPVNAYYLSGEADLPGNILLENRSIEDVAFYVSTNDVTIQEEFTPTLPVIETIASITFENGVSGDNAKINVPGHGLSTGNEVYVASPDTTPAFTGEYTITKLDDDNFVIEQPILAQDATGVNALFWVTTTYESTNDTSPNRLYYSKLGLPEAVPTLNYLNLGPKDQAIERVIALRDYLIVLKSDGVYLVSGNNENFSSRLLDDTATIIAPDSAANLNNQIYCLTTQGITTVTDSGVSVISRVIEDKILDATISGSNYRTISVGVAYENDRAYVLWLPTEKEDTIATQAFRYNIFERSWTRWTNRVTCAIVKQADDKMYIGDAERPYLQQERKNRDRTDHADRDFDLTLATDAVEGNIVRVSSIENLEIGDVLFQEAYLTISQFNRLLIKLDLDKSANLVVDYEDTYRIDPGADMQISFQQVINQLVIELGITPIVVSSDITAQRDEWNSMIDELNLVGTPTISKNYTQISTLIPYESIITDIDSDTLKVTLTFDVPFLQGAITAFKGISAIIQWQPQHYGDPSALKQIREGTIIFDQNNFYSARIEFASDASSSLVGTDFRGKGIAYWGYGVWNDSNAYWGGEGNDIPLRVIIPRDKQRCRYLTTRFEHINAREDWRILGITAVVRALSSRAYR